MEGRFHQAIRTLASPQPALILMIIQPYMLIEFGKHGEKKRLERFIKPHRNQQQYYFIAAEGTKAMPHLIKKIEVDYTFENGLARIVEDDYIVASLRLESALGINETRRLDEVWHVVRHMAVEDDIFDEQRRGEFIRTP